MASRMSWRWGALVAGVLRRSLAVLRRRRPDPAPMATAPGSPPAATRERRRARVLGGDMPAPPPLVPPLTEAGKPVSVDPGHGTFEEY
jgi:hypothetical protein